MSNGRTEAPTPGWQFVMAQYVFLLGVSAVAFIAPPLDTREGRWGVGLALANLTLVILGAAVTWFAFAAVGDGRGGSSSRPVSATGSR